MMRSEERRVGKAGRSWSERVSGRRRHTRVPRDWSSDVCYSDLIRTGKNVKQLVHRSLQIAKSEPQGPVYLMGPREVMEEETELVSIDTELWEPIAESALAEHDEIGRASSRESRKIVE